MRLSTLLLNLKISGYILIPIFLFFLPSDFFDNGRDLCISKILLGESCPACGITRASMRVIHFEFREALQYNSLVLIIFPILALIWAYWFYKDLNKLKTQRQKA